MSQRIPQSLTPDQKRAISAPGREVLVIAPAGSGKTEVLIQRVVRVLQQSAGKSFRLLAVTFTVKAAEELKKRTHQTISEELWRVDANTIHGFALDWLRRYGREVGVGPDVVVLNDDLDRMTVLAEYLRSIGLNNQLGDDLGLTLKPLLKDIDAYRVNRNEGSADGYLGVSLEELADAYDVSLRERGAIDFPGMLISLIRLIDEDKWVLDFFRTLYNEILVDEGQDLTAIQSRLLRNLAGDSLNLFVVADDKQSIKGYAGGDFKYAKYLVPSASKQPIRLCHNFRSATKIFRASQAILRPLGGNDSDVMTPPNTPPGRVRFLPVASPELEADLVVSWACQLMKEGLCPDIFVGGEDSSVTAEDIAIVGRTRWSFDPIIEALSLRELEYVVQTDAKTFLPEPQARLFVDCLALGVNPKDFPASRRAMDELYGLTGSDDFIDPLSALDSSDLESVNCLAELVRRCLEGVHALELVMKEVVDIGESHGWREGALILSQTWEGYRSLRSVQDRSLDGYLQHLEKVQRTRPTDPGVRLLTIDRAKGLEFKAVAIVGARDGMIPHYRSKSAKDRDEERRRLYVAMTRASRELLISWPTTIVDQYGRTHKQQPSRFLVEAGLVK